MMGFRKIRHQRYAKEQSEIIKVSCNSVFITGKDGINANISLKDQGMCYMTTHEFCSRECYSRRARIFITSTCHTKSSKASTSACTMVHFGQSWMLDLRWHLLVETDWVQRTNCEIHQVLFKTRLRRRAAWGRSAVPNRDTSQDLVDKCQVQSSNNSKASIDVDVSLCNWSIVIYQNLYDSGLSSSQGM